MEFVYDVAESAASPAVIKVIGLGGGGCNAINNMIANTIQGVEFISANTDAQSVLALINSTPWMVNLLVPILMHNLWVKITQPSASNWVLI